MSPKNTQPSTAIVSSLLHWQIFLRSWWSRRLGQHLENGLAHLAATTPKRRGPKQGKLRKMNNKDCRTDFHTTQYLRFPSHGCDKLGTNHGNVLRVEIPPHICQGLLRIVTHPNFMQGLLSNGTLTTANLPTKSACMSGDWAPFTPTKDRLGWTNIRLTHSQAGHIFYLRPAQKHHSHLVCLLDRSKQPQPHMIWMVRSVWWWIIPTSCTNALRHQLLNLLERLRVLQAVSAIDIHFSIHGQSTWYTAWQNRKDCTSSLRSGLSKIVTVRYSWKKHSYSM